MPECKMMTKADIQQWEQDLQQLPDEIIQLNSKIATHRSNIARLEPDLASIEAEIKPIDHLMKSINARIEIIESNAEIERQKLRIPPHQANIDKLNPQLEEVEKTLAPINDEIKKLEKVIHAKETQLKIHELEIQLLPFQRGLPAFESAYRTANASLNSYNAEISSLESRISTLQNQNTAAHLISFVGGFISPQQPPPVAVSSHHPHAVGHGHHSHHVACSDNGYWEIERRNAEICDLQRELVTQKSARASQQLEVNRLEREIHCQRSALEAFNNQLASAMSDLSKFTNDDIAWAARENHSLVLESKLQEQRTLRAPHEARRISLQHDISQHASDISTLNGSIAGLQKRVDALTDTAKFFQSLDDVDDLNDRLKKLNTDKKPLADERARLKNDIDQEYKSIDSAKRNILQRENTLVNHNVNYFLIGLRDDPQGVFGHLVQTMRSQFADYDYKFPAKQSYKVRAYLKEFEQAVVRIKNITFDQTTGSLLDNPECRKYLILCGYFSKMVEDIEQEDAQFASVIEEVLNNHHIDSNVCIDSYAPYHKNLLSESELNTYEQEQYNKLSQTFKNTLETLPHDKTHKQLHDLGTEIIKKVDARKSKGEIDIKHAILILENSNNLTIHPSDVDFQNRQKNLANHVPADKAAGRKQCWGILLMFLGFVVTIGSAITVPFTPWGLAGVGAGLATFGAGMGLFHHGRKTLTRRINEFEKKAKEIHDFDSPPAYVPPEPSAPPLAALS